MLIVAANSGYAPSLGKLAVEMLDIDADGDSRWDNGQAGRENQTILTILSERGGLSLRLSSATGEKDCRRVIYTHGLGHGYDVEAANRTNACNGWKIRRNGVFGVTM